MSQKPLQKRQLLEKFMQREILDAAVRLLLEKNIEKITMKEVAIEAGVSRPTLYNYVNGREGLITFIERQIFENIIKKAYSLLETDLDYKEKLHQFFLFLLREFQGKGKISLTIRSSSNQLFNQENLEELRKAIYALFVSSRPKETDINVDPRILTHMIIGTITSLLESGYKGNFTIEPEKNAAQLLNLVLNGINK